MKKLDTAIKLYNKGKISIGKAAEIAEVSTADFKELLAERGIVRIVKSTKKRVKKGIDLIKKSKKAHSRKSGIIKNGTKI